MKTAHAAQQIYNRRNILWIYNVKSKKLKITHENLQLKNGWWIRRGGVKVRKS